MGRRPDPHGEARVRAAVDLIMTVAVAAGAGVITAASDAARSVVRSVFQRPRETSVLVEVDGKRVELTGSAASPEAVQALIEQLRARNDAAHSRPSEDTPGGDSSERRDRPHYGQRIARPDSGKWADRHDSPPPVVRSLSSALTVATVHRSTRIPSDLPREPLRTPLDSHAHRWKACCSSCADASTCGGDPG